MFLLGNSCTIHFLQCVLACLVGQKAIWTQLKDSFWVSCAIPFPIQGDMRVNWKGCHGIQYLGRGVQQLLPAVLLQKRCQYLSVDKWLEKSSTELLLYRARKKTTSPHKTTTHLWEHTILSCNCVTSQFADVESRGSKKYVVQPVCTLQRKKPKWGWLNLNFKEQYSLFYLAQTQMIKDSIQQGD